MWTPSALAHETHPKTGMAWRVVEDQYTTSTRRIVDTKEEQECLEDILEESKPPEPRGTERLHYLLKPPFRYNAPYPVGSRFRRAGSTEGVFYASEEIRTALAELCHYRLRFFQASPDAILPRQEARLTVFSIDYSLSRFVDLTWPPFDKDSAIWTHPTDYKGTQSFAETARQAGIEMIRYASVRDLEPGINMVLLSPAAFHSPAPKTLQTWFLYLSEAEADCERANATSADEQWTFKRE